MIAAQPADLGAKYVDPVYGTAIKETWTYLSNLAEKQDKEIVFDFGLTSFEQTARRDAPSELTMAPKSDAPILMPAHLDLLSQTWPVPAADPEVALYLHGPGKEIASVSLHLAR